MSVRTEDVAQHIRQLFDAGSAVGLTDAELLARFACRSEESRSNLDSAIAEAAFETLVARHGPMVLSVCRQVLGDLHAAEDAFQATFLVLIRRSGSFEVRGCDSLGPWLYGVAYRTAIKARQLAARRLARERRVAVPDLTGSATPAEFDDLRSWVHEEVSRLPAKYRAPVVLCYFEGRTHDEAAGALHWPVGTVRGRLARARDLLRSRLTRRGCAPDAMIVASALEPSASGEVAASLRDVTVATAIKGAPAGASVAALTDIVLRSLVVARLKIGAVAVLSIALLATGAGKVLQGALAVQPMQGIGTAAPRAVTEQAHSSTAGRFIVDPLPKYARARLGDARLHNGNSVRKVLYTPDGKSLVAFGAQSPIRVWDSATGRIIREIGESGINLRDISLSPDGKTLAMVEDPARLRLWDLAPGRERRRWHDGKDEHYQHLAFSPDGKTITAAVTKFDGATRKNKIFVNLWDLTSATEHRRRLEGDWLSFNDLKFSPDSKTLATAGQPGQLQLWDLVAARERKRFPLDAGQVRSIAFSPDGSRLAAGIADGTIRVHDLITSEERVLRLEREQALPPQEGQGDPPLHLLPRAIECLAFSPDGSILAAGTDVKVRGDFSIATIHLWDVARGRELRRIPAHQQWVHWLCFSPDGKTLASTGVGPVIGLWDVATGREAFPQSGHQSYVRALVVSPADGTVFTGGYDGTIRRWDPRSGKQLEITARFTTPADVLAISPDGEWLLIGGSQGGRFVLWSVAERREIRRFPRLEERNPVRHVVFSPDGKTVASERRIWDANSGQVLVTFRDRDEQNNHSANFFSIVYSPDGKEVITAETEGIRIWDIAAGKEARWAVRAKIRSDPVALSPDGRLMATGGVIARFQGGEVDPPIRVWELASGQEVATLEGHEESTRGLAFSPDGRILVSSSGTYRTENDATVRAWDVASGRELRRFEGHRGAVWAVAFTPDGGSVVSASEDGTALVWDVSDVGEHRTAVKPLTAEQIRARWDELSSPDARVAYRASWGLSVPSAVPFLRDHLSAARAPAHKGTAVTEGPVGPPEILRTLRAIAALERVGTPEAREAIETLAHGDPAALETREVTSTLARLKNHKN